MMSDQSGGESLSAKAEEAERQLQEASEAAEAARERTTAEIRSLEADLESQRLRAQEELEKARSDHAEEMERLRATDQEEIQREREAKERAIAAAESRLAEIESQAEAAEKRVEEAQRKGASAAASASDRRRRGARPRRRGGMAAGPDRGDPRGGEAEIAPGREFDVAVVGGGAAGLWSAICGRRGGSRGLPHLPHPALAERQLLGSGRAGGGTRARRLPGAPRRGHDRGRPRSLPPRRRSRRSSTRRPASVHELRERGVDFDLDPDGGLALGLEGGHTRRRIVHAGGSQTGHEITSKLAAMVVGRGADRGARDDFGRSPSGATATRCHGVLTDPEPIAASGDRAGDRRRRRALAADDQPARRDRRRPGDAQRRRAPSWPTSSSASSTRPRWRCPAPSSTAS